MKDIEHVLSEDTMYITIRCSQEGCNNIIREVGEIGWKTDEILQKYGWEFKGQIYCNECKLKIN